MAILTIGRQHGGELLVVLYVHSPPVVVYVDADGRCCRRCDDGGEEGEDQHGEDSGVGTGEDSGVGAGVGSGAGVGVVRWTVGRRVRKG